MSFIRLVFLFCALSFVGGCVDDVVTTTSEDDVQEPRSPLMEEERLPYVDRDQRSGRLPLCAAAFCNDPLAQFRRPLDPVEHSQVPTEPDPLP